MAKKDIIIARCPKDLPPEYMDKFVEIIKSRLPASQYELFFDARSDKFDIELVTKPIIINSSEDLDKQLDHIKSLVKELRESELNKK